MSNYLLLFTIGPVQSFIAQARKTQDLYAGSKLLSDLCLEGLKEVINNHSANPIFPFIEKHKVTKEYIFNDEFKSYPNRFLVEFTFHEKPTDEFINKIGECISKRVQDKLIDISQQLLPKKDNGNLPIGAIEQIKDFLQIYWVIIPFEKDNVGKEDYKSTFTKIERYLGAVKNVRTFKQLNYQNNGKDFGEVGRKCSLNGEYNVKYYRRNEKETDTEGLLKKKLFIEIENKDEVLILDYDENNPVNHVLPIQRNITKSQIQSGEGLSAISMLKRLYEGESFPSTAGICLLQNLEKFYSSSVELTCNKNNFERVVTELIGYFDEQLYFSENHSESYLLKHGGTKEKIKNLLEPLKQNHEKIKDTLFNYQSQDNFKYYAILTFDGDSMGKWLSGDNLEPNSDLLKFHKALSEALSDFAQWATQYIYGEGEDKTQKGQTVYAGGDDFLAFVNLNHLFEVMRALRKEFKVLVSDKLESYKKNKGQELTFSAGIAIAHYKIPLSIVLKEARKMQDHAKDLDGKDAFAITVLKHSGETPSTRMKWNVGTSSVETLRATSLLMDYLLNEKISHSFIYDFHREFARLMDKDGKITELQSDDLIKVELSRLAQRKVPKEKQESIKKFIEEELFPIYSNSPVQTKNDLTNFINFLYICSFVSRHINKPQNSEGK